jgi:predicted Ser/Thr protein kinase
MTKTETIKVQDGDQVIELTGEALKAFLADRAATQAEQETRKAEQAAKAVEKAAILERLGLTEDELKVVLS